MSGFATLPLRPFADEDTTAQLLETAGQMARLGTLVDVRQYVPA